jgi:hypothetical protein
LPPAFSISALHLFVERGERRIDIIEFYAIMKALVPIPTVPSPRHCQTAGRLEI